MFHAVRFMAVFAAWAVLDIVLAVSCVIQWKQSGLSIRKLCRTQDLRGYSYYGILVLTGIAVLALALFTTPNNWDSMTYHLSRIAYWTQNRSVEHYATNCMREIASPVLAEFVNLHVYILCRGSDLFFNLLQAVSYLTCAVLVGEIARKLGCNQLFRFIAMLLYMSMPIAFAEALTTQVDNFATVWLVFYVYVLLELAGQRERLECNSQTVSKVCTLGLCVAWGYLTKPSVCFGMVIFAVWMLVVCIVRKDKVWNLIRLVLCALPCVVLPLMPELLRNFVTFHSYASKATGARQLIGTLNPAYVFVNFVKNFTFNMPIALLKDSDLLFVRFAVKVAELLNVELDAEVISEDGRAFGLHGAQTYGYDTAINPIVLWAFIFCIIWAVICIRKTDWKKLAGGYLICASLSFCVFCAVLRWEPFVTRYMVSYLALLCPMIVAQIQERTEAEEKRKLRYGIVGVVSFLCVMELLSLMNYHLDICRYRANSRPYGYFASRWDEMKYYCDVADEIKGKDYQTVGLYVVQGDAYQYPLWAMLGDRYMEHVNVQNESAVYTDESFTPDCIIWFASLPEKSVVINGRVYDKISDFGEKHYLLTAK
ncbi:MAG: hypothetical protein ACI4C4_01050 [Lachnospiraceae bacterium]